MEKKLTAMQTIIDKCNDSLSKEPTDATEQEIGYSKCLRHVIKIATELLAKEKEYMQESFISGEHNGSNRDFAKEHDLDYCKSKFEDYFSQTFKTKL